METGTTSIKDKITQGPWQTHYTSDGKDAIILFHKEKVCTVDLDYNQNGEANAKAISVVPQMLDLLERLAKCDCKSIANLFELSGQAEELLNELNK
jgi:hypothetical protein